MVKKRNDVKKGLEKLSKQAVRDDFTPVNFEHERMAEWIKRLKFRRKLFFGLDERDVWKKLSQLNDMYEASLRAERARYDALLCERQNAGIIPQEDLPDEVSGEEHQASVSTHQKGKKKQTT